MSEQIYTYYVIRHKPTGWLLPAPTRELDLIDFTRSEPIDPSVRAPRLFTNRRAAANAMSWWLRGWTHPKVRARGYIFRGQDYTLHGIDSVMPDIDGELKKVPRRKEDFETAEVTIII